MPRRDLARPALALALLLSACSPGPDSSPDAGPPECGNDLLEDGEVCDGSALAGESCITQGFVAGGLACRSDCQGFVTGGCTSCGDGEVQPGEACDGEALGAATCETEGFGSGTLGCVDCALDVSGCDPCGNGVLDPGEVCDGAALGDATCGGLGFAGGTPVCAADCSGVTPAGCVGLACEGCGTDCGSCAEGTGCDPATGACAEWCRVTPTDAPLLLDHHPVTISGQVHTRGAALPEGWDVAFRLADGPSEPVVVPVTGGGFEAALRTGVWEATVQRGEETWAAPARVAVAGDASLTLDLPRRVPVQVVAEGLPDTRVLRLEPLDPAGRAASLVLEPGSGPWATELAPGTYEVTLAGESETLQPGALRVDRSFTVADEPARLEVETVRGWVSLRGSFLEDPYAWLEFERVDDGLTQELWPVALHVPMPALLTPGTYRVRLVGSYSDDSNLVSGTVRAVLDPAFVVRAGPQLAADFEVGLHAEPFVALVPVEGRCETYWQLESPDDGHVVTASGPCTGVPLMLPSDGPWQTQATPYLDLAWNSRPVELGLLEGGGRFPVPVHRVGVTVTLDGAPVAGEAIVSSPETRYSRPDASHDGSFEYLLTEGAYQVDYRAAAPGVPSGWRRVPEGLDVTATEEVTLELGPAVDLAVEASRDGTPLAPPERPRLWLVDDRDELRPAPELVTLWPGRYRVAVGGEYDTGDAWPDEAVMLGAQVEVTADAPQATLPLALDAADLSGRVQVDGVAQTVPLRFDQPRPPRNASRGTLAVDATGAFSKYVWAVPGVLLVDGQPLRCEEVSALAP